jgi:glycosyltransferase involved in cell wall biosynthesis
MRSVYVANGVAPERVRALSFYVPSGRPVERSVAGDGEIVILFAGRMDRLKGAAVLLDALATVRSTLGRPVAAVLAGDGPERAALAAAARGVAHDGVRVDFVGWVNASGLAELFSEAHVLAVPSLWPEPFGQIGVEAASTGLPAAAFDVGGIGEWLVDGVSGHLGSLSSGADGLAEAIAACVADPGHYERLCDGAEAAARRFGAEVHLAELLPVLEAAACRAVAR